MKKSIVLACIATLGIVTISASAGVYTFQPIPDIDLADLDHHYFYIWEKDFSLPADEYVIGASLFFDNINDWIVESGDILYMRLLSKTNIDAADDEPADIVDWWKGDSDTNNIYRGYDGQGGGDSLSGYGILLGTYTDDDTDSNPPEDFIYDFTQDEWELLDVLIHAQVGFGIGFDPDCHYWNDGITLTIETVPVPAAVILGSIGLSFSGWLLHKRRML